MHPEADLGIQILHPEADLRIQILHPEVDRGISEAAGNHVSAEVIEDTEDFVFYSIYFTFYSLFSLPTDL